MWQQTEQDEVRDEDDLERDDQRDEQ